MFRLLHKSPVVENLQVDQAHANRQAPEQKHRTEHVEPGIFSEVGVGHHETVVGRWSLVVRRLDKHGGPPSGGPPNKFMWDGSLPSGKPGSLSAAYSTGPPEPLSALRSPSPARSLPPTRCPCGSPDPAPGAPAPSSVPSHQFFPDRAGTHLPSAAPGSSPSDYSARVWTTQSDNRIQLIAGAARHR